jgi:hypothetical protein
MRSDPVVVELYAFGAFFSLFAEEFNGAVQCSRFAENIEMKFWS